MCGFAAVVVGKGGPRDGWDPTVVLRRMSDQLVHRGPDDSGLTWNGRFGTAHRRLSIIDLTTAGRQPMQTPGETTTLAFNGEVYNFQELCDRHDVHERAGGLNSRTDTEIVLHRLDQAGHAALAEFDGMFALAAWDARRERLLLARDSFGVKPLFVLKHDGCFWAASEIKALLEVPGWERRVDLDAVHHYFGLNYIPGRWTAFEGITEVMPGTWMEVDVTGCVIAEGRIGEFGPGRTAGEWTVASASRHAADMLRDAVKRQAVSDVPVGVMLSGGLDSSALAAFFAEVRGDSDFHTFSLAFDDPSFDESSAARQVADALGTEHHEIRVTPERVRDALPLALVAIDEPYADGSAVPTWLLADEARRYVTVLLSGEGGDELHAGYATHAAFRARQWMTRVPRVLRRWLLRPLVDSLPVSHKKLSFEFKAKRFLRGVDLGVPESHHFWREVLSEDVRHALLRGQHGRQRTDALFRELYDETAAEDPLDGLLAIDRRMFLPDDLMVKNDRMTMAHSIEARVPFTDVAMARQLVGWPTRFKMRCLTGKQLLRRGLVGRLPAAILARKKVGLEMPYSAWLTGPWKDWAGDILLGESASAGGLLDREVISRTWQEHQSGRIDQGRALWGLVCFLVWHDLYLGAGGGNVGLPAPRPARKVPGEDATR